MYYSDELIEEVRMKNDIVDVISGYVRIQKKGSGYMGLCPFHNEKSPSFSVSGTRQIYHCFGCGAGGNVFTFLMKYENYTFQEAVQVLADKAGVTLPQVAYSEETKKKEGKRARLLEIHKEAARYFYYQLRGERGRAGYQYLTERGLTEETLRKFGLGFAHVSGNPLVQYLRSRGYEDSLLQEAGLAAFHEKQGMYDKFWNRVMFPIQDLNHRVIGFGGRVMGKGEPKYLNSPETMIFDKGRNLYGLNYARAARKNHIILCEGYMDVISLHQAGFAQAVASLGTAFTTGQAVLLRRYTEEVILAYDSDKAGAAAALRAIGILKESGLSVRILSLEPYKDPDEFMKQQSAAVLEERIIQAENSFFYEISRMEQEYDMNNPESKTRFHRGIAKKLCEFREDVERENYLEAVADRYHIDLKQLRRLVVNYAAQTGLVRPVIRLKSGKASVSGENPVFRSQKLLLTWLTEEPVLYEKIRHLISAQDFVGDLHRMVAERLLRGMETGTYSPADIISLFAEEEEQREVAALFNTRLPAMDTVAEREKALNDIIYTIKKNSYDLLLLSAGRDGDTDSLSRLIAGKKALEELGKVHISLG